MDKYIFNTKMQEMPLGEGEGTVLYDPETENTHILDDISLDIINLFRTPMTVEDVINRLLEVYDAERETVEKDVAAFVREAEANNILLKNESTAV